MKHDWKDYYYIVAIPHGEIYQTARELRHYFLEEYEIDQKENPKLHITLCSMKKPPQEKLEWISDEVKGIVGKYGPFSIVAEGIECFTHPHESLVLTIQENCHLITLQRLMNQLLKQEGVSVPSKMEHWVFHMTILSALFVNKKQINWELIKTAKKWLALNKGLGGTIQRIEVWRPTVDHREKVIASFEL